MDLIGFRHKMGIPAWTVQAVVRTCLLKAQSFWSLFRPTSDSVNITVLCAFLRWEDGFTARHQRAACSEWPGSQWPSQMAWLSLWDLLQYRKLFFEHECILISYLLGAKYIVESCFLSPRDHIVDGGGKTYLHESKGKDWKKQYFGMQTTMHPNFTNIEQCVLWLKVWV